MHIAAAIFITLPVSFALKSCERITEFRFLTFSVLFGFLLVSVWMSLFIIPIQRVNVDPSRNFTVFKFCAMPLVIFFIGFVAFGVFRYWLNPLLTAASASIFTKDSIYAVSVGDSGVGHVEFTPDGSRLLVFGGAQNKVVDANTGTFLNNFPKQSSVSFTISPDSRLVVVPSYKGIASLMNIDGSPVSKVNMTADKATFHLPIAFMPETECLMAPGKDGFYLYKYKGDRVTKVPSRYELDRLVATPDGKIIIATETDGGISSWSFFDFNDFKRTDGHQGKIKHAIISSDGQLLATSGKDKTIKIWNVAYLELVTTFAPEIEITDFDWSQKGKILVAALADGSIIAWDTSTESQIKTWQFKNSIRTISVSPDASKLAVGFSRETRMVEVAHNLRSRANYSTRGESVTPGIAIVIESKLDESNPELISPISESTESSPMSTSFEDHQSVASWLASVRGKSLRVPVVIEAGGLGIDSAILCSSVESENKGQPLRLDDTALGIPLTDSIRNLVDQQTGKCFVWLEGKSGTLLSPASAADSAQIGEGEPHDFAVFKFLGSVKSSPAIPSLSP